MLMAVSVYRPNRPGGNTSYHRVVRDIVRYHGTRANYAIATNGHPRHNHGVHADVAIITN